MPCFCSACSKKTIKSDKPKEIVKASFGLTWVSDIPQCNKIPYGWQIEIKDSHLCVRDKIEKIVNWLNNPPISRNANLVHYAKRIDDPSTALSNNNIDYSLNCDCEKCVEKFLVCNVCKSKCNNSFEATCCCDCCCKCNFQNSDSEKNYKILNKEWNLEKSSGDQWNEKSSSLCSLNNKKSCCSFGFQPDDEDFSDYKQKVRAWNKKNYNIHTPKLRTHRNTRCRKKLNKKVVGGYSPEYDDDSTCVKLDRFNKEHSPIVVRERIHEYNNMIIPEKAHNTCPLKAQYKYRNAEQKYFNTGHCINSRINYKSKVRANCSKNDTSCLVSKRIDQYNMNPFEKLKKTLHLPRNQSEMWPNTEVEQTQLLSKSCSTKNVFSKHLSKEEQFCTTQMYGLYNWNKFLTRSKMTRENNIYFSDLEEDNVVSLDGVCQHIPRQCNLLNDDNTCSRCCNIPKPSKAKDKNDSLRCNNIFNDVQIELNSETTNNDEPIMTTFEPLIKVKERRLCQVNTNEYKTQKNWSSTRWKIIKECNYDDNAYFQMKLIENDENIGDNSSSPKSNIALNTPLEHFDRTNICSSRENDNYLPQFSNGIYNNLHSHQFKVDNIYDRSSSLCNEQNSYQESIFKNSAESYCFGNKETFNDYRQLANLNPLLSNHYCEYHNYNKHILKTRQNEIFNDKNLSKNDIAQVCYGVKVSKARCNTVQSDDVMQEDLELQKDHPIYKEEKSIQEMLYYNPNFNQENCFPEANNLIDNRKTCVNDNVKNGEKICSNKTTSIYINDNYRNVTKRNGCNDNVFNDKIIENMSQSQEILQAITHSNCSEANGINFQENCVNEQNITISQNQNYKSKPLANIETTIIKKQSFSNDKEIKVTGNYKTSSEEQKSQNKFQEPLTEISLYTKKDLRKKSISVGTETIMNDWILPYSAYKEMVDKSQTADIKSESYSTEFKQLDFKKNQESTKENEQSLKGNKETILSTELNHSDDQKGKLRNERYHKKIVTNNSVCKIDSISYPLVMECNNCKMNSPTKATNFQTNMINSKDTKCDKHIRERNQKPAATIPTESVCIVTEALKNRQITVLLQRNSAHLNKAKERHWLVMDLFRLLKNKLEFH